MTRVRVKRASGRLPSVGYGCTLPLAGIGAVWIVLASLAISQWDSLHVLARIGSVACTTIGVLFTLPLLGLWTLKRWLKRIANRLATELNNARTEGTRRNEDPYAGDLQYRPAEEIDLQGIERDQYEQASSELLGVGCALVGDVVSVKTKPANDIPAVQRMLVSGDGRSWLIIHREGPSSIVPRPLTVDIVSEFVNGTFCCTSNASVISMQTQLAQLRIDLCSTETPPAEIMRRHEASLKTPASSDALTFAALADVLASQQRKYAITAGFQKMIGF